VKVSFYLFFELAKTL